MAVVAEVRALSSGDPQLARAFRAEKAAAVQVLMKGPLRMVRIDSDKEDAPGESRLTVIDAEGTTLEIFGPTAEIRTLTEDRFRFIPAVAPDVADFYELPPELRGI